MLLLIYLSLYLVILVIDFHGFVWSPEIRSHQDSSFFWFEQSNFKRLKMLSERRVPNLSRTLSLKDMKFFLLEPFILFINN